MPIKVKHNIVSNTFFASTFLVLSFGALWLSLKPTWFTNFDGWIDPWFYWGVGSNWQLSYSFGFGETYYLQRFVVLIPIVAAHWLFGPLWSILAVALFWLAVSAYFFLLSLSLFTSRVKSILCTIAFLSILPIWVFSAITSTVGATIALCLAVTYFALYLNINKGHINLSLHSFALGSSLSLLTNSYLYAGVYIGVSTLFFFVLTRSIPRYRNLFYIIVGFLTWQVVLQFISVLITKQFKPILLSQVQLGMHLATSENPWNGGGFFDFWIRGAWHANSYFWRIIILLGLISILFAFSCSNNNTKRNNFNESCGLPKTASQFVISILLVGLITTAFFINPIGYPWSAAVFIPILLLSLICLSFFQSTQTLSILALLSTFSSIFFFSLASDSPLLGLESGRAIEIICLFTLLGLFLVFLMFRRAQRLGAYRGFAEKLVLVLMTLTVFSTIQTAYPLYSFERPSSIASARDYYSILDQRRDHIQLVLERLPKKPNLVWFDPDSDFPLFSSQLWAYSLVSLTSGEATCNQFDRKRPLESVLVSTRYSAADYQRLNDYYLRPCGFLVRPLQGDFFANSLQLSYFRFTIIDADEVMRS